LLSRSYPLSRLKIVSATESFRPLLAIRYSLFGASLSSQLIARNVLAKLAEKSPIYRKQPNFLAPDWVL
jgi:alanine-alpha-ketoisovalerate/valine-pyruvate aminotransferase